MESSKNCLSKHKMVIIKCMKEIKTKCIKINRIPKKKTSFLTKTINI